jgi:HTH-type transcriptional regulator, transcriptional repressor of NAD biosynthesis genes
MRHGPVRKICFYGPESTGKSTLARQMAQYYHAEFVPEVSREIITSNDFTIHDIIVIGKAQTERVLAKERIANTFLFCDTDLITTQIYSRQYLGVVPPVLYELEAMVKYDQYFLFDVDVPWVSDGLRDLGGKRREMYKIFKGELDKRNMVYTVVSGSYAEREMLLRSKIDKMLQSSN